ncbi:MAG: sugar ABC transporter ATP-binding protein [Ktedonobacteraceae bacterium]|nr:sugar ABC transporter ATP-binding protein [Ktedonobacteraceae bacterium]
MEPLIEHGGDGLSTGSPASTDAFIRAEQVSKQYPGVQALRQVDFGVHAGEVRALLGVNGAGKSTLVKVLSGAVQPDAGTLYVNGAPVHFSRPTDAIKHGIATVYQELSIVPGLTVAENIMLGQWPQGKVPGLLDRRALFQEARQALSEFDLDLPLEAEAGSLTLARRQLIEIARAVAHHGRLLILDEPTSSLSAREVALLMERIRLVAARGVAIIFVSHRMQEIQQIADSITVMRDGMVIDTVPAKSVTTEQIVEMMIGEQRHVRHSAQRSTTSAEVVLSVRHLTLSDRLQDISFDLHRGEILGLAGLLGSGRTEILRCIMGMLRPDSGTIAVNGSMVRRPSLRRMRQLGVGMTPEDRRREGFVPFLSTKENLALAGWHSLAPGGFISERVLQRNAQDLIARLSIVAASPQTPVETLSGGNQQKVVIGKWLSAHVSILLLDEPTRGVDVQAKQQIYSLIQDLSTHGLSILYVSSEMDELWSVCDRVLALNMGRIVGDFPIAETTLSRVMALTMGGMNSNAY